MNKKALIVVDLQNDFMPGGSLGVALGHETVAAANKLMESGLYDVIVATQDWHPANHSSFKLNDPVNGIWPAHCIQNTNGAKFHNELVTDKINRVFQKGTNPKVDSYSGIQDNDKESKTGLADYLKDAGIEEVHVMGLATDYCVKATALDAISEGFNTVLLAYASRAVNIAPDDEKKAIAEVLVAGGKVQFGNTSKNLDISID